MVRGMPRGRALAVGAALGVVVLGGCDSAAETTPSASPSTSLTSTSASASPSPTSTPSPTPSEASTIPAAARKRTPEGAEAFVKYFFDQYNEAWTRPEPGLISDLSSPDCDFCRKAEKTSKLLLSRGDRYDSAPVTVRSTESLAGAPEPEVYVFVELIQNESDILSEEGEVVHSDPRMRIPSNVAVRWSGGRWMVVAVEEA